MDEVKYFQDEDNRKWKVTRKSSGSFKVEEVEGKKRPGEKLHDIARSCAKRVGVTETAKGIPIDHVNEHIRTWNAIWNYGKDVDP